jgi:hypothetical protein
VGLVRADGTTKPSYDALRGLVKGEWWLPATKIRTDAVGRAQVRGFLGDYRLSAVGAGEALFALEAPGEVSVDVRLPPG